MKFVGGDELQDRKGYMGFSFRKSKSLGGLKLNFSKSGIGISTGVKGFRVSAGSKGVMLNLGKKGIYYRKKLDEQVTTNNEENKYEENAIEISGAEWDNWGKSKKFYKYGFLCILVCFIGSFFNNLFILFAFPAIILILIAIILSITTIIKIQLIKNQDDGEQEEI